jgi:hypothetical protein
VRGSETRTLSPKPLTLPSPSGSSLPLPDGARDWKIS